MLLFRQELLMTMHTEPFRKALLVTEGISVRSKKSSVAPVSWPFFELRKMDDGKQTPGSVGGFGKYFLEYHWMDSKISDYNTLLETKFSHKNSISQLAAIGAIEKWAKGHRRNLSLLHHTTAKQRNTTHFHPLSSLQFRQPLTARRRRRIAIILPHLQSFSWPPFSVLPPSSSSSS